MGGLSRVAAIVVCCVIYPDGEAYRDCLVRLELYATDSLYGCFLIGARSIIMLNLFLNKTCFIIVRYTIGKKLQYIFAIGKIWSWNYINDVQVVIVDRNKVGKWIR
jgi:hypothetical protein